MCINRDNKPYTCMCGCTLTCGLITVGVFRAIGAVSAISTMNPTAIVMNLLWNTPFIALAIWKNKWGVRQLNYIWELISFILMIIGFIVAVIFVEALIQTACSGADFNLHDNQLHSDEEHCERSARPIAYTILGGIGAIILPIQYLIMSIFKAYAEEIKDEAEYQQIPGDDQDTAINNMA